MNKKLFKTIKTIIVVVLIVSLILSFIVSHDYHHLDTCEVEHCSICTIIHMAQNIVNLTVAVFIYILTSFLIYFFLSRLSEDRKIFIQESLVFRKIQLNE